MQDIIPPPTRPATTTTDDAANRLIQQKIAEKKAANLQTSTPNPSAQQPTNPVKPIAVGGEVKAPLWRRLITGLLVTTCIASCLSLGVALWANRTLLNTTKFVDVFAPLSENTKIQQKVAASVTDRILSAAPAQELAAKILPDAELSLTDDQLRQELKPVVNDAVSSAVLSPQFAKAWRDALTTIHSSVLTAHQNMNLDQPLEIKMTPILNEVLDSFKGGKLGFIADEQRQNILSDKSATFVIEDTKGLKRLDSAIDGINTAVSALLILSVITFVAAVAISPYRFRTTRKIVFLIGLEMLLIAGLLVLASGLISKIAPIDIRSVADVLVNRLVSGLILQNAVIGVSLVVMWALFYVLHRTKLTHVA